MRAFVAVAERLHFRKAAEQLHIAQPALSRQIQALERQLGTQLFARDRRSVELTAAGRQLLQDALPLLAQARPPTEAQRAARGPNRLVVGFRAGIAPTPAIHAFHEQHPDVAVDIVKLEWDEQEDAILGGRVDVAYVRRPIARRGVDADRALSRAAPGRAPGRSPAGRRLKTVTEYELAAEAHLRYLEPPAQGEPRAEKRRGEARARRRRPRHHPAPAVRHPLLHASRHRLRPRA